MEFTPILESLSSLFLPTPYQFGSLKSSVPLTILIISPHPDDESIVGSLPLRLHHENGARLVNVAITLGSNEERKKPRLKELTNACKVLQMELKTLVSEDWKKKEKELKSIIKEFQPQLILAPHLKDHHPTHIKTGKLLKVVLQGLKKQNILVAWTEFWGQITTPNLLIEVPSAILKLQLEALQKHVGEVERNPYHLRLPAWMIDNVRRGGETIGGKGTHAPEFPFAVIYQLQILKNGQLHNLKLKGPFLDAACDIGQIFKLILEAAPGSKTKVK
jgi:LmbE family N-acetylglucosaminyl deacetylase